MAANRRFAKHQPSPLITTHVYSSGNEEVTFRQVRATEASAVFQILLDNGQWMLENGIEQWPMEWLASLEDEVTNSVRAGGYWCMDTNGSIDAVVEVRHAPEQLWGFDSAPACYIHKLAIRRPTAGQSPGSKLLSAVIDRAVAQECTFVRLDCVASNQQLRSYYENVGFRFVGIRRADDEVEGEIELALYELALGRE